MTKQNLYSCLDCKKNTMTEIGVGDGDSYDDWYMVKDEIWKKYVPEHNGFLCMECLEERMGRSLCKNDFLDVPVNKRNLKVQEKIKK